MPEENSSISPEELERLLAEESHTPSPEELAEMLDELHISEVAELLQRLPRPQRLELWAAIEPKDRGGALLELSDAVRDFIIESVNDNSLAEAASFLESDDLAELIRWLPSERGESVIALLDRGQQREVSRVLTYDSDRAGSQMNLGLLKTGPGETIRTVITRLRRDPELTRANDVVFVVDDSKKLIGDLLVKDLLLNSSKLSIADVMDPSPVSVFASDPVEDAVRVIRDRDLTSLAVVNNENVLLGQITVDDIVDVVDDQRAQSVVNSVEALTRDEDLFAPIWQSTMQRALWLGINLITAFMASAVVGLFGGTIEQAVGLAVLMPIVASMGGIAGSQTLVLVIRGLALNLVNEENVPKLAYKEFIVGLANGVIWAIIIAVLVYVWMGELWLTNIIMLALLINIIVGTFTGVVLPLFLRKIGSDPAISANVILTTVTDVVGLGVFLGVASLYLG